MRYVTLKTLASALVCVAAASTAAQLAGRQTKVDPDPRHAPLAVDPDPRFPRLAALGKLADAATKRGDYPAAEAAWRQSLAIRDDQSTRLFLASTLYLEGNASESLAVFDAVAAVRPAGTFGAFETEYADDLLLAGRVQKARELYFDMAANHTYGLYIPRTKIADVDPGLVKDAPLDTLRAAAYYADYSNHILHSPEDLDKLEWALSKRPRFALYRFAYAATLLYGPKGFRRGTPAYAQGVDQLWQALHDAGAPLKKLLLLDSSVQCLGLTTTLSGLPGHEVVTRTYYTPTKPVPTPSATDPLDRLKVKP